MARYANLDRLTELIAGFEAFRGYVYDDATWPSKAVGPGDCRRQGGQYVVKATGGVATIGYGETDADFLEERWASGITREEATERLRARVDEFAAGVESRLTRTPTARQAEAMVSLAYNIGLGGFAGSTVLRLFNAGDVKGAAGAFLMWVTPASLRARRLAEVEHFLTPGGEPAPPPRDPWGAHGRTVVMFVGD